MTDTARPTPTHRTRKIVVSRALRVALTGLITLAALLLLLAVGPMVDARVNPVILFQAWTSASTAEGIAFTGRLDVARDCDLVRARWTYGPPDLSTSPGVVFLPSRMPRLWGIGPGRVEVSGVVPRPPLGASRAIYASLRYICGPLWTVRQTLGPVSLAATD